MESFRRPLRIREEANHGNGLVAGSRSRPRGVRSVLEGHTMKFDARSNADLEAAVNRGLQTAELKGWLAGAEAMEKEGVPFHVAARVMLYPERRRPARQKNSPAH